MWQVRSSLSTILGHKILQAIELCHRKVAGLKNKFGWTLVVLVSSQV